MALPLDVLERSLNKTMSLLLKDGRSIDGTLVGYDQYMNLVMDDAEESRDDTVRRLGTIVLRGNNLVSITPK